MRNFIHTILSALFFTTFMFSNLNAQDKAGCCTSENSSDLLCCHGHDINFCCTTTNIFQAPIGVLGDHSHHAGGWMFSYRYMYMDMKQNMVGTDDISIESILNDHMMAPSSMTMQMHMLGTMFSPSDRLTVIAMLPYRSSNMTMEMMSMMPQDEGSMEFRTRSSGLGDFSLNALYTLLVNEDAHLLVGAGLSFPTGDIGVADNTPMAENAILPYPMKLGSGTLDILPSLTYALTKDKIYWGIQVKSVLRTGENERDHRFGNSFTSTTWFSYQLFEPMSASVRVEGSSTGTIVGKDPSLNPMMAPTANPKTYGGDRIDSYFGLNFYIKRQGHQGTKIGIESGIPLLQDINGPQLSIPLTIKAGVQHAF